MVDQQTFQQQMREQVEAAQGQGQQLFRAWNELTVASASLAFDAAANGLRYNQEARREADRMVDTALSAYRQMFQNGAQAWQNYVESVNGALRRNG